MCQCPWVEKCIWTSGSKLTMRRLAEMVLSANAPRPGDTVRSLSMDEFTPIPSLPHSLRTASSLSVVAKIEFVAMNSGLANSSHLYSLPWGTT